MATVDRTADSASITKPSTIVEDEQGQLRARQGISREVVAELTGRQGVCIRAGHHCAQPLMRCLGVGATARASVGVYSEQADIDALVQALIAGREVFGL